MITKNEKMSDIKSTELNQAIQLNKEGKIIVKKNCKIGSHSVIMPGVTIGENSIIGAFSFVNKDIPNNVIAVGVPAKVIKKLIGE